MIGLINPWNIILTLDVSVNVPWVDHYLYSPHVKSSILYSLILSVTNILLLPRHPRLI
jgi:hypothetical protein